MVRRPVTRTRVCAELERGLPFEAEIMICEGREIIALMSEDHFGGQSARRDIVPFVSVLARRPHSAPQLPLSLPSRGKCQLKVLACRGRFVLGLYRRRMEAIRHLGALDRLFGVPATTRGWSTIVSVVHVLEKGAMA